MATTLESMTGVLIQSPFFGEQKSLELFPSTTSTSRNRVALIYGANGSGKSTLAQGFREYVEATNPRSVALTPLSGTTHLYLTPDGRHEKIHVFDETYISNNIRLQRDGLGSIVLLGHQVQIEQRIAEIDALVSSLSERIAEQEIICNQYSDANSMLSPLYWSARIYKALRSSGGWAEIDGIRIKKHQIKTKVTDAEIKRLGEIVSEKTEEEIRTAFEKLVAAFENTSALSTPVSPEVSCIPIPYSILSVVKLQLAKQPQRTPLSEREQKLLDMMGVSTLTSAKGFLCVASNSICPQCLQPVSMQHRSEMLALLENILNREIEDYQNDLRALILQPVPEDAYDIYSCVDAELVIKIRSQLQLVNNAIVEHNNALEKKIAEPMGIVDYEDSHEVGDALESLNGLLSDLEKKRIVLNRVIASRKQTIEQLIELNDLLGHFAITEDYSKMKEQNDAQASAAAMLTTFRMQERQLIQERMELDAQRKNYNLAVAQINLSLSYIYCSKTRFEIVLETDQRYHLKVNGQPVTPDRISCGERNALALCYYFTDIAKETDFDRIYQNEMLLVIDDPISSFDVENRIGILSFLRFKLNQVLLACSTTKILITTHDVSVLFDLQKAMDEISSACGAHNRHAYYKSYQLKDKALAPFQKKSHNEYTNLVQHVYEYACNPTDELDLLIGNITRRMFEAFTTFMFKKGTSDVTLDESILSLISDPHKREYFQNSMYRLVLNTESHLQEAVRSAPEASFYSHISREEKQRTTRDILCFMYSVNKPHILAHLPGAEEHILSWIANI